MNYRKITVPLLNAALALHRKMLINTKVQAERAAAASWARVRAQQQVVKHEQVHLSHLLDVDAEVNTEAQAIRQACNSELDALPQRWS